MRIPKFLHFRGSSSGNALDQQIMQVFIGSGTPFKKNTTNEFDNEIICLSNINVKCYFDGEFKVPNLIPYKQTQFPFL